MATRFGEWLLYELFLAVSTLLLNFIRNSLALAAPLPSNPCFALSSTPASIWIVIDEIAVVVAFQRVDHVPFRPCRS